MIVHLEENELEEDERFGDITEELQECREVDSGVAGSTGGTTGRGIKRDDTDGYMERLELPEVSRMVTSGISIGDIPEWCRVDGNRQWWRCRNRITGVSMD